MRKNFQHITGPVWNKHIKWYIIEILQAIMRERKKNPLKNSIMLTRKKCIKIDFNSFKDDVLKKIFYIAAI